MAKKSDKRQQEIREIILFLENNLPPDNTIIKMVINDLKKRDFRMASSRCIAHAGVLDKAPTVKAKLCQILPDLEKFLKNRYAR